MRPNPTIVLKHYPAKHPVTAIMPYPYFANAEFATTSKDIIDVINDYLPMNFPKPAM